MATISRISLCPPPLFSIFNPKTLYSLNAHSSSLSFTSPPPLPAALPPKRNQSTPIIAVCSKSTKFWRISAISGDFLLSEADPIENSEQIVSTNDDGVSYVISVLLLIAFVGLSILTVGVIYIAVTDFLQKRERDKFEKEEAGKKKSAKKGKVRTRARAGPRGFGQKIDDEDEDAD
ncbi:unnamed protein product [Ilex paraguariensis]|uniref:Transmembrane protein n=1 Tax=Ilex paraguariensis TaxID=185542 RepID=A0ABC8V3F6_9AQUA